jgi:hypothetical protein
MDGTRDYAITVDEHGSPVCHRANCPAARAAAARGEPVLTMLGCEKEPPGRYARHSCLQEDKCPPKSQ